jgi:hypothetical protein
MEITRTSRLSGVTRTLTLNVTHDQLHAWATGTVAQDAFPQLTPDEREFIISGVTSEEWEAHFGSDDDEDEPSEPSDEGADGEWLASAGWGTDEDYGGCGE